MEDIENSNLYTRLSSCERPEALVEAVGENDSLQDLLFVYQSFCGLFGSHYLSGKRTIKIDRKLQCTSES